MLRLFITAFYISILIMPVVFAEKLTKAKPSSMVKKEPVKEPAKIIAIPEIPKTALDKQLDALIENHYGADFKRASIYDFYPLELPAKLRKGSEKKQQEWLEYYDYSRKDLEKISRGKLLKAVSLDFDLDRLRDYAVIISRQGKFYLAIFNLTESLYFEPFEENYLEKFNYGTYPSIVIYAEGKKRVETPCLKLISFEDKSSILYYDKQSQSWNRLELQY